MSLFRLIPWCCCTYWCQSCTFQLLFHGHEDLAGRRVYIRNSALKTINGHFHKCRGYRVPGCGTESFISSWVHTCRLSPSIRGVSILISRHLQSMSELLSHLNSNRTELERGEVFSFRPSRELMTKVEQPSATVKQKSFRLNDIFCAKLKKKKKDGRRILKKKSAFL